MSTSTILIYIFFGASSLAYIMYGKTQRKAMALFSGIGMGVVPYFSLEMWQMVVVSIFLMVVPFFVKI